MYTLHIPGSSPHLLNCTTSHMKRNVGGKENDIAYINHMPVPVSGSIYTEDREASKVGRSPSNREKMTTVNPQKFRPP